MQRKLIFEIVCIAALIFSHLHLSYDFNYAWWYSALGTVLMSFFGFLVWGRDFGKVSGLYMPRTQLVLVLATAVIVTLLAAGVMYFIASAHNIHIQPQSLQSYVHDVFYIVNEELILGSLFLYFLTKKFKLQPFLASLLLALLVAAAHYVFYRWDFRDRGVLTLSTLTTLFFTSFLKNTLIVRYKHIGFAWALHFGWMVVMFGSLHTIYGVRVSDLVRFNLYLGSFGVMVASAVLAGAASLHYLKKT